MPLRLKGNPPRPGEADRRYYMIDVQEGNRRVRISSGTRDLDLAERREQTVLDALRANPDLTQADLQGLVRGATRAAQLALLRTSGARTLKQACDEALNDKRPWGKSKKGWGDARSRDTYKTNCRELQRHLGPNLPVAQINQERMDALVDALLAAGDSKTTVNRKVFALRSVMRREQERHDLLVPIPKYIPFDESENAREFVLSPEDERELFGLVLDQDLLPEGEKGGHPRKRDAHDYHDLFVLLVDVGCRLTAGLRIQWRDIYEENGVFFVRFWRKSEQKGSKQRTTPLTSRAAAIIGRRRSRGGIGPFDGMTKRRAQHLWDRAKQRSSLAGESEAVIHCLRHTCATRMLQATGDIKLVQEWLGHSAIKTTSDIYAKVMTAHKVDALRAFEARWTNVTGLAEAGQFRDRNLPVTGRPSGVTH